MIILQTFWENFGAINDLMMKILSNFHYIGEKFKQIIGNFCGISKDLMIFGYIYKFFKSLFDNCMHLLSNWRLIALRLSLRFMSLSTKGK